MRGGGGVVRDKPCRPHSSHLQQIMPLSTVDEIEGHAASHALMWNLQQSSSAGAQRLTVHDNFSAHDYFIDMRRRLSYKYAQLDGSIRVSMRTMLGPRSGAFDLAMLCSGWKSRIQTTRRQSRKRRSCRRATNRRSASTIWMWLPSSGSPPG